MDDSILNGTKKMLGLDQDYTVFDTDIVIHINSVFLTLTQLGIGSPNGFMIEDADAVWSDFIGNEKPLNAVKSYIYLRVRCLFDPPTASFVLSAMQEQIRELEWRINVQRESIMYPITDQGELADSDLVYDTFVIDGGTPLSGGA